MEALQGVLARAEQALAPEDFELIAGLCDTLYDLQTLLRQKGSTIARLRRMFGLSSSEKTAEVLAGNGASPNRADADPGALSDEADKNGASGDEQGEESPGSVVEEPKQRSGHGRLPSSAYLKARQIEVPHDRLSVGQTCPECARGKLYRLSKPAVRVVIEGQSPLSANCYHLEQLRCSACQKVFTAKAPEEAQGSKYSETAVSMVALLRYGVGMPFHRLDNLQKNLQTPLPASTQWDVVNQSVGLFEPIYDHLVERAARGSILHNDDTYARILEFMGKRRAKLLKEGKLEDPERTGLFTTGIVSITEDKRPVTVFATGRKHAGENLGKLLANRPAGADPPVLMCDGLSRNVPKEHRVIESNCMAHGRRKVVDEVSNFPEECEHLLLELAKIYEVDEACRNRGDSDEERLRVHQEKSKLVLDDLQKWMQAELDEKRIEPNSGLGEAFNYMLKRWEKLTIFLTVPGAAIDNNIVERALKMAIRHRRNSLFYRSQHGAWVGDIFMTIIHTTEANGENPFDYLTALQLNAEAVAQTPSEWLPWTYRDTLDRQKTDQ
jgi:hypothetical protein